MSLGTHSFSWHRYNLFCSSLKSFSFPLVPYSNQECRRDFRNLCISLLHYCSFVILLALTNITTLRFYQWACVAKRLTIAYNWKSESYRDVTLFYFCPYKTGLPQPHKVEEPHCMIPPQSKKTASMLNHMEAAGYANDGGLLCVLYCSYYYLTTTLRPLFT